jgi:hypothetical protein
MPVKFLHIRNFDKGQISATNPKGISNFGGATIAFEATDLGLFAAVSRCHPNDNFEKALGRTRAAGMFKSARHLHQIHCHGEVETQKDCITRWYQETFKTR